MPNEQYKPIPFVDTAGLTRGEWLEYRKHGFGASDIAVVMEQSEYKSVLALFHEKVSRRSKEELDMMVFDRRKKEESVTPTLGNHFPEHKFMSRVWTSAMPEPTI